uniref:Uncharacterized protein n=1 Tax=Anguilla anguilla TaxID=7936 RepID=A0A0E9XGA9_ANGAN
MAKTYPVLCGKPDPVRTGVHVAWPQAWVAWQQGTFCSPNSSYYSQSCVS